MTFVAVVAVVAVPVKLPTNVVEVVTPLTLIPPDPVINLLFRSRLPPNRGVVS